MPESFKLRATRHSRSAKKCRSAPSTFELLGYFRAVRFLQVPGSARKSSLGLVRISSCLNIRVLEQPYCLYAYSMYSEVSRNWSTDLISEVLGFEWQKSRHSNDARSVTIINYPWRTIVALQLTSSVVSKYTDIVIVILSSDPWWNCNTGEILFLINNIIGSLLWKGRPLGESLLR